MGSGAATIERLSLFAVRATPRTLWLLSEAEDGDGNRGFGEATLAGCERDVAARFAARAAALVEAPGGNGGLEPPGGLAEAAARSGIDQAVVDLAARRAGVSVAELLGLGKPGAVTLYANINRGTVQRSPAGFAANARDAVADGFAAVKIAPFDSLPPAAIGGGSAAAANRPEHFAAGLARMRAVREAVGPEAGLFVDCHGLLCLDDAAELLRTARDLGVAWIEAPIPETAANAGNLTRLRALYEAGGVKLAGGELLFSETQFRDWADSGGLDVLMPDVKHLPSLRAFLASIAAVRAAGREVSPHNPTGPIAHAFTWQIAAAAVPEARIEMQYREAMLFCDLVGASRDFGEARWNAGMPSTRGIGFELRPAAMAQHLAGVLTVWRGGRSAAGIFAAASNRACRTPPAAEAQ